MPIQTIIVRLATPISSGAVHSIDLGFVSVRDAAIYGRARPLIPYAEGRVISSVRFVPPATVSADWSMWFMTPNTTNFAGFGVLVVNDLDSSNDTLGLIGASNATQLDGQSGHNSQILDCGPLIAGINVTHEFEALGTWTPNTRYALGYEILDSNGNIQVIGINGVSGGSEPTWEISGTTDDGTAQWTFEGALPSADAQVHAVVEVIEGVSPMPPYPATLEFIQQPTDAVAEATISPAITVKISDQNGDPYVFTDANITLKIYGAGTLVGTVTQVQDKTTGVATFDDLSITEPGTGYILRAELYPTIVTEPIFSDSFDIT